MRLRTLALFSMSIALATCDHLDNFQISQKSSTTIRGKTLGQTLLGDIGFGAFNDLDITQDQSLKNQGVTKEQIDSVRVVRLNMKINSPSGADFRFLERLEFFVSAPGLERKRIASGGPFPMGQASIDLAIDDVNLKPYVAAPSLDITTTASGQAPDQDTAVEATIDLDVDVDVGGAICG